MRGSEFNADTYVGIDVGGTKARAVLVDPNDAEILARGVSSSAGAGPVLTKTLALLVQQLASDAQELPHVPTIGGVGLAAAGLTDNDGIVHYSPNLPELIEFPLGPELSAAVDLPVCAGNDASAGTWAEARAGAGRGYDDFIFVALGTGIGTGAVANGQLVTGANGYAGEAGHMIVDRSGPQHLTGAAGPWELFASGNALTRLAIERAAAGDFPSGVALAGAAEDITGLVVQDTVQAGQPDALALLRAYSAEVALGVANLIMVLDPALVVVGGGVSDIGEPLRATIEEDLRTAVLGSAHRKLPEVVIAQMGAAANAIGAALIAAEADRAAS